MSELSILEVLINFCCTVVIMRVRSVRKQSMNCQMSAVSKKEIILEVTELPYTYVAYTDR